MSMQIEPAQNIFLVDVEARDAARLAEFGARTFRESFGAENTAEDMQKHLDSAWSPEKQLAELKNPDIDTVVLTDGADQWLAFAQLRANQVSDGVPAQGSIELWRFYVEKSFHGRGVAQLLMTAAKQKARARGANSVWLGVWERNERAKAFYAKHGFRKVGKKVFVVGSDPQTDDVMLCSLA